MKKRAIEIFAFSMAIAGPCFGQDLTLGYSKSSGMAGAGLALRYEGTGSYPRNPAVLAYMQKFRLTNLDFGYVLDGINFSDVGRYLDGFDKGGLDPTKLQNLAKQFGGNTPNFGLNARLGAGSSGINVGIEGNALVRTTPNSQLQQWVQAGSNPGSPVPGMRLDGHGFGYSSVNVGYGRPIPTKDGSDMAVGAQVRFIRSYYSHHFVTQDQIINGGSTRASEMGASDVLSKNGMAVDFGWHLALPTSHRVELAAVLNNVIKPNVGFEGTEPNSINQTTIDPFERSINFGVGFTGDRGQVFAADLLGLGSHNTDFRFGIDLPLSQNSGVRAGYSTLGKFTAGVTLSGISLTFGTTNQFQAGTFFRF